MGATKKFFHIFGVTTGVVLIVLFLVIDFNSTDWTESAFITKNKIDGFVLDKTVSFVTTLGANFVTKEGVEANTRNDIELLTEKLI